jgi:hypothetical protein
LISSVCVNNAFGEFDMKSCISDIPKNATNAEKIVFKNKCNTKEKVSLEKKYNITNKKKQLETLKKSWYVECEKEYPKYKILGEKKYLKMMRDQVAEKGVYEILGDICFDLYKDSVWTYKGKDREQKLWDWSKTWLDKSGGKITSDSIKIGHVDSKKIK